MLNLKLKVTRSDIPIIRAGVGNLILPGLVIWLILGLKLIEVLSLSFICYFFLIVIILYFFREYVNTVSMIHFFKDRLEITTSLSHKVILINEISDIKISSLLPSSNIKLIFNRFEWRSIFPSHLDYSINLRYGEIMLHPCSSIRLFLQSPSLPLHT